MFLQYRTGPNVDACEAERSIIAAATELAARAQTYLVPLANVANRVMSIRRQKNPEEHIHWHWYPDERGLTIWFNLQGDESFADLEPVYDILSAEMRRLSSLGYGPATDKPLPDDELAEAARQRDWTFAVGELRLRMVASFYLSNQCRLVPDGTKTVDKFRLECGPSVETLGAT